MHTPNAMHAALGRIYQVQTTFGRSGPERWSPRWTRFVTPKFAGLEVIGDLGVHKADLLRFVTGEEVTSVAAFESRTENGEVEDNGDAVMVLSGGGLANLSVSWTMRGGDFDETALIGEQGSLRIRLKGETELTLYRKDDERVEYDVQTGIPRSSDGALLVDEIPQFLRAALGEEPNPTTGEDGYRALEICAAMDRSAGTNTVVHLPLEQKESERL